MSNSNSDSSTATDATDTSTANDATDSSTEKDGKEANGFKQKVEREISKRKDAEKERDAAVDLAASKDKELDELREAVLSEIAPKEFIDALPDGLDTKQKFEVLMKQKEMGLFKKPDVPATDKDKATNNERSSINDLSPFQKLVTGFNKG